MNDLKQRALTSAGAAALALVVIAPAAASWHGLVGAGRDVFGLTGGWEYVVPLTLDGAALYSAVLAMRAILAGDSAFGARFLTAIYALSAATFNGWHAKTAAGGNLQAAIFFAGASLSAVVLWDVTLRALRRDQLRAAGLVEAPLPRWRLLRWLVAPVETARAWRLAVVDQITDPAEALKLARAGRSDLPHTALAERITDTPAITSGTTLTEGDQINGEERNGTSTGTGRTGWPGLTAAVPGRGLLAGDEPNRGSGRGEHRDRLVQDRSAGGREVPQLDRDELTTLSKKDALRAAFTQFGARDIPAALAWLADRGVIVDRSYAYTVAWTPPLRAVDRNTATPQNHNTASRSA